MSFTSECSVTKKDTDTRTRGKRLQPRAPGSPIGFGCIAVHRCNDNNLESIARMLALRTLQRGAPRWLATRAASTTPVALVGCGMPGRGMGWYHVARGVKLLSHAT